MWIDYERKFGVLAFEHLVWRYSSDGEGSVSATGTALTDRRRRAMISLGLAVPGGGIETLWPSRF